MAKKVLVTGCSSPLGAALCRALVEHPLVREVAGIDVRPPPMPDGPRFHYHPADVRDSVYLRNLFEETEADTVFHPALLGREDADPIEARSIYVTAAGGILEAASKTPRVQKLVFVSGHAAYGTRRGNPPFLKEEAPLRARPGQAGHWARAMEEELSRLLPDARPGLQVSVLRVCPVVGGWTYADDPVAPFLALPIGLSVLLRDCALQRLSQADLLRTLLRILETPDFRGAFNVAPDDRITLKALWRRRGVPHWRLPYWVLWLGVWLARRFRPDLGLSQRGVRHLRFAIALDNAKIKRALGIEFRTSAEEAFFPSGEAPGGSSGDLVPWRGRDGGKS